MRPNDKQYVAISAIWYERFLECSRTQGTDEFPNSVMRFYYSLLNINDEDLAIQTKVKEYMENVWEPSIKKKIEAVTSYTNDMDTISVDSRYIIADNIHLVFTFIIQTIQDSGIGWHTTDATQSFNITQE